MSSRLILIALAASLVSGCGFLTNKPSSGQASANRKPPLGPDATASALPTPSTQPADPAPTTQPASILPDPNAYERAIEEYFQRKAQAAAAHPNTRPVNIAMAPANVEAPAPANVVAPPPAQSPTPQPDIRWIEPPGPQPRTDVATGRHDSTTSTPATSHPDHAAGQPPSANTAAAVPDAPRTLAAPRPVISAESSDQLESKLVRHIQDYPRDLSAQLDYQILQMLRGRQVPQLDAISTLPAEDREVLATLLDALANFRAGARDDNLMLSRKIRPLVELSDRLRSQASLRIPTIALCTRVDAFGVYEPLSSDRFVAGRKQSVIVYCEVENFASRLNDRSMWQTDLTHEAVLYNDKGQRVLAEEKKRPVTDLSRNRRHDFFVVRLLKLPAGLPSGRYNLVVSICDQQAQRVTEASLPIQIAPEP